MKPALQIIKTYKCPYCGRTSERESDILHCINLCRLATIIDDELFDPEWTPPLPLYKLSEWNQADRHEFARRLDWFAKKHYGGTSSTNTEYLA